MWSIGERVRYLVRVFHGGSVNAAATAIGIPQRTLAKIADDQAANPRVATLQPIARFHRVSLDWLLSGKGAGPETSRGEMPVLAEALSWYRLLEDLALNREASAAYGDLPESIGLAASRLVEAATEESPGRTVDAMVRTFSSEGLHAAARHAYLAWVTLLEHLIRTFGRQRVREALNSQAAAAGLGFLPAGTTLLAAGVLSRKAVTSVLAQMPTYDEDPDVRTSLDREGTEGSGREQGKDSPAAAKGRSRAGGRAAKRPARRKRT